ncbi:MAG: RNA methyltransferase [Nitriliruptoraceae bacterium]
MPELTSRRNPRVRRAAALQRRRTRDAQGRHLADGPHAVDAALEAGLVEELFVSDLASAGFHQRTDVRVTTADSGVLEALADAVHPQGVVAVVRTPVWDEAEVWSGRTVLVADALADPGNLGTIVRASAAMGVDGLVLTTRSVDPFAPKVIRATAGAIYGLPLMTGATMEDVLAIGASRGFRMIGLDARGSTPVTALGAAEGPIALIAGSEAHGLSAVIRTRLDDTVAIPMVAGIESLNVAIAIGIALYERNVRVLPGVPVDGAASGGD